MNRLFLADDPEKLYQCYSQEHRKDSLVLSSDAFFQQEAGFPQVEYLFSTWGMPPFTEAQIFQYLPNLKAVFFAGGSVKYFADPFFLCGVRVFGGWQANALSVAEFLTGQILLANKGYFQLHRRYQQGGYDNAKDYCRHFPSNHRPKVGFLGFGAVTRATLGLLYPFSFDLYVHSDFITAGEAQEWGVSQVDLPELFETCHTISNNLASVPGNIHKINEKILSKMGDYTTFINTGRGSQVNMEDLTQVLQKKPTCTALLDVTDPVEPLPAGHPLFDLPNVFITPHIAGSMSNELLRLGGSMISEYQTLIQGGTPSQEITRDMLTTSWR